MRTSTQPRSSAVLDRAPAPPSSVPVPGRSFAVAQAMSAPTVAASVHEDAQARADQGALPPTGTLLAPTIAQIRDIAVAIAKQTAGEIVGVTCAPDQRWSWLVFPSRSAADDWYGALTDAPETFLYAAYYDKTDGDVWPEPLNELFGAGKALTVTAHTNRPAPPRTNTAVVVVIGALGLLGVLALASTPKEVKPSL